MSHQPLSNQAADQLSRLVERLVRASGQDSYQAHIKRKVAQSRQKLQRKMDKARTKLGRGPEDKDLAEEIHQYLTEAVNDLMAEGHSEADAIKAMAQRFDQAEATPGFAGFAAAFNDFGLVEAYALAASDPTSPEGARLEAVGLFYGGFLILGLAAGSTLGWLAGRNWVTMGVGTAAGAGTGIALGLLSNAVITLKRVS